MNALIIIPIALTIILTQVNRGYTRCMCNKTKKEMVQEQKKQETKKGKKCQ